MSQAYAALRELERKNYLLTMTRGEDDEITDIVITPESFRCADCRLIVSSRQEWEAERVNEFETGSVRV